MKVIALALLLLVAPVLAQDRKPPVAKCLIVSAKPWAWNMLFDVVIGTPNRTESGFYYVDSLGWEPDLKVFSVVDLEKIRDSAIRIVVVGYEPGGVQVQMARAACAVPAH